MQEFCNNTDGEALKTMPNAQTSSWPWLVYQIALMSIFKDCLLTEIDQQVLVLPVDDDYARLGRGYPIIGWVKPSQVQNIIDIVIDSKKF